MSRGTVLAKLWLLLWCVAASRQVSLSITEFEVPQAVQSGENVELKCSHDLGDDTKVIQEFFVKWWLKKLHDDKHILLYQRLENFPGAVSHNASLKPDEQDTIVRSNVTPADSGTYVCEVSNKKEVRRHQDMIVFTPGSGPQLNMTTVADGPDEDEEDDVRIECEASGVAPAPLFILTLNGVEVNMTVSVSGPDDQGLYEIFGNTTISKAEVKGADVRCELFYVNPNITHQPYFDSIDYSGGGSTTEAPEDTAEPDMTTTDSMQDERGFSCQPQASWMLLAVPVIAHITSLV